MRARTTGSFAVFSKHDGKNVTPRGRKARALLAYLISDPGTQVPKGRIAGLLWGDRGEAQARSSLRQTLRELRSCINASGEMICSDREHVWLQAEKLHEDPADEGSSYKDAFQDLDGISPEFDEWLRAERSRRSRRRSAALKSEATKLLRKGRGEDSLVLIERMQAIDAHDEDALRLGMEAEFKLGHSAAIAERYRASATLLFAELGVEPSEETRGLRDRLIHRLTARHEHQALSETDEEHFTRRAREERDAAARAQTVVSRQIHERLANRYARLAVPLRPSNGGLQMDDENGTIAGMARYLRKALVIQALRWFKHGDHPAVLARPDEEAVGFVDTPEGRLRVDPGDWIITGIAGENYPCKPDIFQQLYELQE